MSKEFNRDRKVYGKKVSELRKNYLKEYKAKKRREDEEIAEERRKLQEAKYARMKIKKEIAVENTRLAMKARQVARVQKASRIKTNMKMMSKVENVLNKARRKAVAKMNKNSKGKTKQGKGGIPKSVVKSAAAEGSTIGTGWMYTLEDLDRITVDLFSSKTGGLAVGETDFGPEASDSRFVSYTPVPNKRVFDDAIREREMMMSGVPAPSVEIDDQLNPVYSRMLQKRAARKDMEEAAKKILMNMVENDQDRFEDAVEDGFLDLINESLDEEDFFSEEGNRTGRKSELDMSDSERTIAAATKGYRGARTKYIWAEPGESEAQALRRWSNWKMGPEIARVKEELDDIKKDIWREWTSWKFPEPPPIVANGEKEDLIYEAEPGKFYVWFDPLTHRDDLNALSMKRGWYLFDTDEGAAPSNIENFDDVQPSTESTLDKLIPYNPLDEIKNLGLADDSNVELDEVAEEEVDDDYEEELVDPLDTEDKDDGKGKDKP